jgi:hypothetical protein
MDVLLLCCVSQELWPLYPEEGKKLLENTGSRLSNCAAFRYQTTVILKSGMYVLRAIGDTMLQAGRRRFRLPMESLHFFSRHPSSLIVILGSTQLLTEISTRNLPVDKGRPEHKAGNLTAISEPIV